MSHLRFSASLFIKPYRTPIPLPVAPPPQRHRGGRPSDFDADCGAVVVGSIYPVLSAPTAQRELGRPYTAETQDCTCGGPSMPAQRSDNAAAASGIPSPAKQHTPHDCSRPRISIPLEMRSIAKEPAR